MQGEAKCMDLEDLLTLDCRCYESGKNTGKKESFQKNCEREISFIGNCLSVCRKEK